MRKTHDVIGGGSAGYAAARTARAAGADVAIVDQGPLAGLCILRGCMPTKAILRSAEVAAPPQAGEGVRALPGFGPSRSVGDRGSAGPQVCGLLHSAASRPEAHTLSITGAQLLHVTHDTTGKTVWVMKEGRE